MAKRRIGRTAVAAIAVIVTLMAAFQWSSVAEGSVDTRPCSKRVTKQAIKQFVRAYNRGDSERLDRLFAEEPEFRWYSTGPPGVRPNVMRRSTLISYFSARHRRHDRLHLNRFSFNGKWGGASNFGINLLRRADRFNRGRWFRIPAKGALICEGTQPKIIVMSLGGPQWLARR